MAKKKTAKITDNPDPITVQQQPMAVEPVEVMQQPEAEIKPFAGSEDAKNWVTKLTAKPLVLGSAIGALAIVGLLISQNIQNAKLKQQVLSLTTKQVATQSKDLIAQVGKLIVLPTDEQPTIATVTDLAKLQSQPFFQNAKVGDKVLIYPQAKKAVLYRPDENKLVELAPLNVNVAQQDPSAQPKVAGASTDVSKLNIEIRNGSGKSGVASSWKAKLNGTSGMTVSATGNAASTYDQTEIVDLTGGKKPALVSELQQLVGGQVVTSLPSGESTTNSDVVVIIGKQ